MWLSILFGGLCGLALGLTGGGGSILAVPMLVYGIGIPFREAAAISLLVVGFTSFLGFLPHLKNKQLELSAGILLAITGILFAPVGSYISTFINGHILMICFAILMFVVGLWTWFKSKITSFKPREDAACHYSPEGKLLLTYKCKSVLLFSGAFTGILAGLFGVGGGFLVVPALIIAAKMPIKKAISTSLLIIFLVSISGFLAHLQSVSIDWFTALYFILGGAVGMAIATIFKSKISPDALQKVFAILLLAFAIIILMKHFL